MSYYISDKITHRIHCPMSSAGLLGMKGVVLMTLGQTTNEAICVAETHCDSVFILPCEIHEQATHSRTTYRWAVNILFSPE